MMCGGLTETSQATHEMSH